MILRRRPELDRSTPSREVEGAQRFRHVVRRGAHVDEHHHLRVAAQSVLCMPWSSCTWYLRCVGHLSQSSLSATTEHTSYFGSWLFATFSIPPTSAIATTINNAVPGLRQFSSWSLMLLGGPEPTFNTSPQRWRYLLSLVRTKQCTVPRSSLRRRYCWTLNKRARWIERALRQERRAETLKHRLQHVGAIAVAAEDESICVVQDETRCDCRQYNTDVKRETRTPLSSMSWCHG